MFNMNDGYFENGNYKTCLSYFTLVLFTVLFHVRPFIARMPSVSIYNVNGHDICFHNVFCASHCCKKVFKLTQSFPISALKQHSKKLH